MKAFFIFMLGLVFLLGCAKMQVGGTKEPIKVDISMRLDIYQHVQKDIDAIEDIVSGAQQKDKEKAKAANKQSLLGSFLTTAYAQEGLSPEVEQAALRRRDRLIELNSWEAKGVVGENKSGLVEVRNLALADSSLGPLVEAENNDRMIIYRSVAKKNGTSVEEVQELYAKRLHSASPGGTPIETLNASGAYEWKVNEEK